MPLLLLPLLCGVAFPLMAWLLKRAMEGTRDLWGVVFVANAAAAIVFAAPFLLLDRGGSGESLYQPFLCGVFFFAGQVASFRALSVGDISLAVPVQGVKVLLVALFASAFLGHAAGWKIWAAAGLTSAAIFFLRDHPPGTRENRKHWTTVLLAAAAAVAFASLDVGIQAWASEWGVRRFGFWTFSFQAFLSLGLLLVPGPEWRFRWPAREWAGLLGGSFGMALISFALVWVIAASGRAAWVNVLFNSRVLWSVGIVWLLGRWIAGRETRQPGARRILAGRLAGAGLMMAGIVLAVL